MDRIAEFLASVPMFAQANPGQLNDLAKTLTLKKFTAGDIILQQGKRSDAIHLLVSGKLAVKVDRLEGRTTVAYLNPPAPFGEISYITGKPVSADVEAVTDAEVVIIPREILVSFPEHQSLLYQGLVPILAERLYSTVTSGAQVKEEPVILLRHHANWTAARSFAAALTEAIGRLTQRNILLVNIGIRNGTGKVRALDDQLAHIDYDLTHIQNNPRSWFAKSLAEWLTQFRIIVVNPVGQEAAPVIPCIQELSNVQGDLLGPGDTLPASQFEKLDRRRFSVQSSEGSTLPILNGGSQLIWDSAAAEEAYQIGQRVPPRFQRTVNSIARYILDLQVGLALGGGAAWGFAHIGVLDVLERAGFPIDVISGCSMGSIIGAARSSGLKADQLREFTSCVCKQAWKLFEFRVWRLHLLREMAVMKTLRECMGDRQLTQVEIPFWANAADINNGREVTLKDRSVTEAVRASVALPGLLPPLRWKEHLLIDAGIMNTVPVRLVKEMGCRFAVGINVMQPLQNQELKSRYLKQHLEILLRCLQITGHEIGKARSEAAADFTMSPILSGTNMLDFGRGPQIIALGQKAAEEHLAHIQKNYERVQSLVLAKLR